MSLFKDLLERPFDQAITSKYTAMNGFIYLGLGALVLIWPGMVQTIFRDAAFVGNEASLIRVMGMTVMVIGWLYLFGGLSGGRRIVAASVLDRVVLVPLVLVPLAIGEFFLTFCSRLQFSTRRSALALGCSSVDRMALDFTRPAGRYHGSSRICRPMLVQGAVRENV
jgi:hypothetical protein